MHIHGRDSASMSPRSLPLGSPTRTLRFVPSQHIMTAADMAVPRPATATPVVRGRIRAGDSIYHVLVRLRGSFSNIRGTVLYVPVWACARVSCGLSHPVRVSLHCAVLWLCGCVVVWLYGCVVVVCSATNWSVASPRAKCWHHLLTSVHWVSSQMMAPTRRGPWLPPTPRGHSAL